MPLSGPDLQAFRLTAPPKGVTLPAYFPKAGGLQPGSPPWTAPCPRG